LKPLFVPQGCLTPHALSQQFVLGSGKILRARRRVPHQLNVTVIVAADDCHRICLLGIGQQRVACRLKASPVKGAPKLVGTPVMVGTPVWVVAQAGMLQTGVTTDRPPQRAGHNACLSSASLGSTDAAADGFSRFQ